MKTKTIVMAFAVCLFSAAVCLAANPHMGTWTLNEAKSHLATAAKNTSVVYEASGNDIKVSVTGVDAAGNPSHNEWTGRFNGKFYAVTNDPTSDTRSYRVVNSRTMILTAKKGKQITLTGRIVVSANGKMRTVTTYGTDANGKRFKNVAVYDKE